MPDLVIHPAAGPLVGSVPVPGDKSIAHRAILLAGIATGTSRVQGGALGEDNAATLGALRAMGVRDVEEDGALVIQGAGLDGLRAPDVHSLTRDEPRDRAEHREQVIPRRVHTPTLRAGGNPPHPEAIIACRRAAAKGFQRSCYSLDAI